MSLRKYIFLLTAGVSAALLIVINATTMFFHYRKLLAQTQDDLSVIMSQNKAIINSYIRQIDKALLSLSNDEYLYSLVSEAPGESYTERYKSRIGINHYFINSMDTKMKNILDNYTSWFFIDNRYDMAELFKEYTSLNNKIMTVKPVEDTEWYKKTIDNDGKLYWFSDPAQPGKLYTARLVKYAVSNFSAVKDVGVVLVKADISELFGAADNVRLTRNANYLILEPDNTVHMDDATRASFEEIKDCLEYSSLVGAASRGETIRFEKERYLASVFKLDSEWLLIGLTPYGDVAGKALELMPLLFVATMASFVVFTISSYIIANKVSSPIVEMTGIMSRTAGSASLETPMFNAGHISEFNLLHKTYEDLIQRINILIEEVYEKGMNVKQAEIKTLQAQINPHFLYNTLDSISWAALGLGDNDIPDMINSLSNILRYGIREPDKLATLEEEIEIVRDYFEIQKFCYDLFIDLLFEMDEAALHSYIPKLSLQPLVENAVKHGFLERNIREGFVRIRVEHFDKGMSVSVENPGDGDIEKINAMLRDSTESYKHGVKNVNVRLKMLYGEQSGLRFMNTDGNFIVKLRIFDNN